MPYHLKVFPECSAVHFIIFPVKIFEKKNTRTSANIQFFYASPLLLLLGEETTRQSNVISQVVKGFGILIVLGNLKQRTF
jgi:hypothetical protein